MSFAVSSPVTLIRDMLHIFSNIQFRGHNYVPAANYDLHVRRSWRRFRSSSST